ncbi:MAG TPA: hypothetical protein VF898_00815 [Chloroflexota bacterium]
MNWTVLQIGGRNAFLDGEALQDGKVYRLECDEGTGARAVNGKVRG